MITPELLRERPDLAAALTPRLTKYIKHEPTKHQTAFLLLDGREALFGGAKGGGKTDALIMAALQYVDVPGYSALILRRTFPELNQEDAIMRRTAVWLAGTDARWSAKNHRWTFPSGATLTFGYLEHRKDRERYQGAAFQFIGIDELGVGWDAGTYKYLLSCLRKPSGYPVPLRMRATANPGAAWIRERFVEGGPNPHRAFIPSRYTDNPYLDQKSYAEQLAELAPLDRARFEHGDWYAVERGGWFAFDRERLWDRATLPRMIRIVRFWDRAATAPAESNPDPDWTIGIKVGMDAQGRFWVLDIERHRLEPPESEEVIQRVAREDGQGVEQWFEQEPGSAGKAAISSLQRQTLRGLAVFGRRATGSKEERAKPLVPLVSSGLWRVVAGRNVTAYLDVLEGFPLAAHDDDVDASSGALGVLSGAEFLFGAADADADAPLYFGDDDL